MALKVLNDANSAKARGACSDKEKSAGLWKLVWKLNCPNRIKHFLWRACKNILPTNFYLALRKVTLDSSCGLCGGFELLGHDGTTILLLGCGRKLALISLI